MLTRTEWIKGLLAVPFVLYSQPNGVFEGEGMSSLAQAREEAHRRYSEICRDVELMIDDHSMPRTFSSTQAAQTDQLQLPTKTTPRTPSHRSSSS